MGYTSATRTLEVLPAMPRVRANFGSPGTTAVASISAFVSAGAARLIIAVGLLCTPGDLRHVRESTWFWK